MKLDDLFSYTISTYDNVSVVVILKILRKVTGNNIK